VRLHRPGGDGPARSGVARDVARRAGSAAGRPAADAFDAVAAVAFGAGGADLSQPLLAARAAVAHRSRHAVAVDGASRTAGRAVAAVGRAGLRGGRRARARAVAGARQRGDAAADRAGGRRTLRARFVQLAAARAVAEAVGRARHRALVAALAGGIAPARRDGRARPRAARQRARYARTRARGPAADALGTDAARAFAALAAHRARRLQAARSAAAHARRRAVGVGPARRVARGGAAAIREAGRRRGDRAGAGAVAGPGRRERRCVGGTAGGAAGRPLRVALTGAGLALPVVAAARGAGVHARRHRIGLSVGDVGADAHRRGQRARLARTGAACRAADALGADARHAFAPVGAEGAVRLEAARVVGAHLPAHAVGVRRTRAEAAGPVAREGRARNRVARDAIPGVVAGSRGRVDVVLAALGRAHRSRGVGTAPRGPVALPVVTAAGRALVHADAARIGRAGRGGRAPALRRRQRAAPAGAQASLGAADAVDAEVAGAFAGGRARLAVRFRAAAAVIADLAAHAVVVVVAAGDAGAVAAAVRRAGLHTRRVADAQTVAGAGGVEPIAAARRRNADRLSGVHRAAADAVAGPGLPARRLSLVLADTVGIIGAGVDRPAGADAARLVAADAGAFAADVAANAVGAEPGCAVLVLGAYGAGRFGPAAAVDARDAAGAIGAGPAGDHAGLRGRIAVERRAHRRWPRLAPTTSVADIHADD